MRLIKLLGVLILAGLIGLAGYAYFGDMEPQRREIRTPISTEAPARIAPQARVAPISDAVAATAPAPAAGEPAPTTADAAPEAAEAAGDLD